MARPFVTPTSDEVERMRAMRAEGRTIEAIMFATDRSRLIVERTVRGVVSATPSRGRATLITPEAEAEIIAQRKDGAKILDLAKAYHVGTGRVSQIVAGIATPRQSRTDYEPTFVSQKFNVRADMEAAGVPRTAQNIAACIGHSRQWMRLYASKLSNPCVCELGEPENAVARARMW